MTPDAPWTGKCWAFTKGVLEDLWPFKLTAADWTEYVIQFSRVTPYWVHLALRNIKREETESRRPTVFRVMTTIRDLAPPRRPAPISNEGAISLAEFTQTEAFGRASEEARRFLVGVLSKGKDVVDGPGAQEP